MMEDRVRTYHVVSQGDDDELRVLGSLLDVRGDDGDLRRQVSGRSCLKGIGIGTYVSEIQGSVDFVHHVQRSGLVVMQSEDQSQTGQGLLTTGQVADVLPALLRGHDGEQDTLGEGIQGVDQLQLGVTAHGDHLVHLLESKRDDAESLHESVQSRGPETVQTCLGTVARGQGSCQISRASLVLCRPATVFINDREIDRRVLALLFKCSNDRLKRLLVHLGQLVLGVGLKLGGLLFLAQIANVL
ncbi:hypothetical protein P170DRAFT_251609 [Aspergillus steynii IBT 23096]|uniref:Uncharacterized protein n=1 Tax=Aspergillus steynii IBT 23096 TaxID=1392250 RepID=A0A2I2FYQ2_9EURO|nr:uncharacterized protein P170DRAFT_251609 [Aspergillus steynii IBT 23096]PLB45759.1 hypothetical protein P170DRAFT_251609 [Aspergillus steynii IBT 23096]